MSYRVKWQLGQKATYQWVQVMSLPTASISCIECFQVLVYIIKSWGGSRKQLTHTVEEQNIATLNTKATLSFYFLKEGRGVRGERGRVWVPYRMDSLLSPFLKLPKHCLSKWRGLCPVLNKNSYFITVIYDLFMYRYSLIIYAIVLSIHVSVCTVVIVKLKASTETWKVRSLLCFTTFAVGTTTEWV